ncbi:hypothetical protein K431DRAFT_289992 [Polychaeton citri CBS 116435]|uniref:Uncharacterized protein n=1 Tax=Polychaeton citri CBS 116435 TaxID=1314669 RepID=A0A9P4QJM7_9PEZI|nr:hypothetical protein K431DRAFT_289992 [Polychaeton citri CBS 116435]
MIDIHGNFRHHFRKHRKLSFTLLEPGEGGVFNTKTLPFPFSKARQHQQHVGFLDCRETVGVYLSIDSARYFAVHIDVQLREGDCVSSIQSLGREDKIMLRAAIVTALEAEMAPIVEACRVRNPWWWFGMNAVRIVCENVASKETCKAVIEAVLLYVDSPMGLPDLGYLTPCLDPSCDILRLKVAGGAVMSHAADSLVGAVEHLGEQKIRETFDSFKFMQMDPTARQWRWVLDHDRADLGWQRR